jgi:hypothetical protein
VEDRKDMDWMDVIAELQTKLIKEEIGEDATEDEIHHGLRYRFYFDTCLCHRLISNVCFSVVYYGVLINYIQMMMNYIICLFMFDIIVHNKEISKLVIGQLIFSY